MFTEAIARKWWDQEEGTIAFFRLTQLGFLRLVTAEEVMDGKPLSLPEAWRLYNHGCSG
jgi:hypothetical protein